jgi:hypothetical protein
MSDNFTALVWTVAIIALLFAWVPFLKLICLPCARFLKRRLQKDAGKKAENAVQNRPLSARRIGLRLDLDN